MSLSTHCQYQSPDGITCQETPSSSGLCFWHDPNVIKDNLYLTDKLEHYVRRGGLTQGLQLRKANLENVNLVNSSPPYYFDFSYSDMYRCNLFSAHLFNLRLTSGSLMKARMDRANLNCANLINTNLLGVSLKNARTEHMKLGVRLLQEQQAKLFKRDKKKQQDCYEQAEEIYRILRNTAQAQGLTEVASHCLHKEMTMRRMQHPLWSKKRVMSKLVDLFCGYGEKPFHTILFSMALIVVCACGYFVLGLNNGGEIIRFSQDLPLYKNLTTLFSSLYFSVVTFTTLGYGDITPVGYSRLLAAIEAFTGSFTIAMFVVVFVKRMYR